MEQALTPAARVGRSVDAGRGAAWWSESWTLFMKNPAMWLVFGIIFIIGFVVLAMIPIIGSVATALLGPVIAAGWMLSARKLEGGGTIEVADLFAGFKDQLSPLILLGVFSFAASMVIMVFGFIVGGGAMLGLFVGGASGSSATMMASAGTIVFVLLVCVVLSFLIAMAFWYAPALVVFRNLAPIDAIKASWSANTSNVGAFLVYGLIWIVAAIIASIPLALGWFVMLPLTMLGMYVSYQDIFERS